MNTLKISKSSAVFLAYIFVFLLRVTSGWWLPPLESILMPQSAAIEQVENFRTLVITSLEVVDHILIILLIITCFGSQIYTYLVHWLWKRKYYQAALAGYSGALKLKLDAFW